MGGLLQQKAYSQQRALSLFFVASRVGPRSNRVRSVVIPSLLWNSCSRGQERDVGKTLIQSSFKHSTSNEAKTIHGIFKVSDPPWHEQVLLISQSRQIEWRGGGRNILTRRQIAGGSRNEPGGAGRREWKVFYSERFVQCPGERSLPHTVTPWFSRLWLCYETCESTRTEQTSHDCFSTQSLSQSSHILTIFKSILKRKKTFL